MTDRRFISSPPQGHEGWRTVWRDDLEYRAAGSPLFFKRLVSRFLDWLHRRSSRETAARQRDFNLALLEILGDLRHDLDAARKDVDHLLSETAALRQEMATLSGHASRIEQRVESVIPLLTRRSDGLVSALDQKIEWVAASVRDLATPLITSTPGSNLQKDFLYRRMEEKLRGSPDELRASFERILPYTSADAPLLDIGCGRGELLELCRDEGIKAHGYDTNERSIAELLGRGLSAHLAGIPGCFDGWKAGDVGTVVASHVVEHIDANLLMDLFSQAFRVLRTGGFLVIETPNAKSMLMSSSEIWRDPTHLAPRHIAALTTLGREVGFELELATTTNPFSAAEHLRLPAGATTELVALVAQLNALLIGDQNLLIVFRK